MDQSINLVGVSATVSGFGVTSDISSPSQFLKYASMPIISNAQCESYYGNDTVLSSVLCTGTFGGPSSCGGN